MQDKVTNLRQLIGQLKWLATQTRPDLNFNICELSSIWKQENGDCIKQVNKAVKKPKREKYQTAISNLASLVKVKVVAYTDASFANLLDVGSQRGYTLFLVCNNSK